MPGAVIGGGKLLHFALAKAAAAHVTRVYALTYATRKTKVKPTMIECAKYMRKIGWAPSNRFFK